MYSVLDTYDGVRYKPLAVQIAIVVVCLVLVFCAIGIPLLIKPSSDFDVITENCGGHMTDDVRLQLLRDHNKFRSQVAKGNYKIDAKHSPFRKLPQAVRMYQLKYNCSLEKSALKWARIAQCRMKHSQWEGLGENLYASGGELEFMDSVIQAVFLWADEVREFGVQKDIDEWTHEIGHATQVSSAILR
ncbi:SCP domain-containing protein, partial [Trichostrongylus colubriformis]